VRLGLVWQERSGKVGFAGVQDGFGLAGQDGSGKDRHGAVAHGRARFGLAGMVR